MKWNVWVTTVRLILLAGALASGVTACSKREKISAKSLVKNNSSSAPGQIFNLALPTTNPFTSADSTVQLQGTCVTGSTVALTGPETADLVCSSGVFSFQLSQSTDGTYTYTLTQSLPDNGATTTKNFQWIRDSSLPPSPTVTTPPMSPVYTNTSIMMISGACVPGNQIQISGDLTASTTCSQAGSYSASVLTSNDNSYQLEVRQKNTQGTFSAPATVVWVRDTLAPSAPVLTAPLNSTVQNSLNSLALSGTCETHAVVSVTGDLNSQTPCSSGTFTMSVSATSDGTYQLRIKQTDLAGNESSEVTRTWIRSTAVPAAPQIVSPSPHPILNNLNSVLVNGSCDTGNEILYSTGSDSGSTLCSGNAFSVTLSAATDGERTYSFIQKTAGGLTSSATPFVWKRDTVAPASIVVSGPGTSPYTSSGSVLTLTGTCEPGAQVVITGPEGQATPACSSGQFSQTLSASSDGSRTYTLKQIDGATNESSPVNWTWVRDSSVPVTPILTSPLQNPYFSNQSSLQLTGTCISGNTVRIEGNNGVENSTACSSNSFTLTVSRSVDQAHAFNIYQKSTGGVDSAPLAVTWNRDTVAPATPTFNSPATSPFTSSGNSIVIAGQCEDFATITLDGDAQQQTACSGGNYSFQVSGSTDALRNYLISQTDRAGNTSGLGNTIWIRDTVAPLPVAITSPGTNPFISGNSTLALVGTCEIGAGVELTSLPSNQVSTQPCSESGTFTFQLTQPGNGTYLYTLLQRDAAGNASPGLNFEWTIDNSIPPSPSITSPTVNPVYTQTGSLTLQVSCAVFSPTVGVVRLSGDLVASNVTSPAGALTTNCNNGSAQFVLQKPSEGNYSILIDLYNPNTDATSAPISLLWVVDSTAPAAPILISPSSDPYVAPGDLTLQGSCETGTTLKLEGASTHTETCQGGTFDWTISHLPDGEYDFTITQTDLALNASPPTTLHWTRSENALAPPVILSPSNNPHTSNQTNLTVSGSCTPDATVNLAGAQTGSTACSSGGQFSFTLSPSSDGLLVYNLSQTRFGIVSATTAFQWSRDTLAPTVQLTSQPPSVNLSNTATFTFTSNETGSTFECKLDSGNYSPCTSPVNLTVANGMRAYSIRATDSAGNVSLAQTVSWEQKSFNTIALYRFSTSGALTTDSGPYLNHLTNTNSVAYSASGPFAAVAGSASFTTGATRSLSVAQNDSLNLGTSALTIEGFFNVAALTTKDQYYTLVSKASSATSLSYEIRLTRGNNNNQYFIDVLTQLQGSTTVNTLRSSSLGAIANTWIYFAVTYSQGAVTIRSGTTVGQATTLRGTASYLPSTARLNTTNSTLRIGTGLTNTNQRPLVGMLDEIRISQTLRNTGMVPSQAFDPNQ